ncbi:hypothetical protein AGMMS49975_27980 [Clostridia bacterium]|nr:hypothetical protein AGMMS49975_27980 [Clostridia bacterium]
MATKGKKGKKLGKYQFGNCTITIYEGKDFNAELLKKIKDELAEKLNEEPIWETNEDDEQKNRVEYTRVLTAEIAYPFPENEHEERLYQTQMSYVNDVWDSLSARYSEQDLEAMEELDFGEWADAIVTPRNFKKIED